MNGIMDWGVVGAIVLVALVYVIRRFARSKESGCGCGCGSCGGCGTTSCSEGLKPLDTRPSDPADQGK